MKKYPQPHPDLRPRSPPISRLCLSRSEGHLLRLRTDWVRKDLHHERSDAPGSSGTVHFGSPRHIRLPGQRRKCNIQPQFRHLKARLSFYEIYCGKLYDLLNKRTELKLREDNKNNINIIGLEEASVNSTEDFIEYLSQGSKERVTSQNSANADSSRSHAILQITLKDGKKTFGKISFIDLAGNERGADHMDMNKQTRIDGA